MNRAIPAAGLTVAAAIAALYAVSPTTTPAYGWDCSLPQNYGVSECPYPTKTPTKVPTNTPTTKPTYTSTPKPTSTFTPIPTFTATLPPTFTPTRVSSFTPTTQPSNTPTLLPTKTATATQTVNVTATPTATDTTNATATATNTTVPATSTTSTPTPPPTSPPSNSGGGGGGSPSHTATPTVVVVSPPVGQIATQSAPLVIYTPVTPQPTTTITTDTDVPSPNAQDVLPNPSPVSSCIDTIGLGLVPLVDDWGNQVTDVSTGLLEWYYPDTGIVVLGVPCVLVTPTPTDIPVPPAQIPGDGLDY